MTLHRGDQITVMLRGVAYFGRVTTNAPADPSAPEATFGWRVETMTTYTGFCYFRDEGVTWIPSVRDDEVAALRAAYALSSGRPRQKRQIGTTTDEHA